MSLEGARSPSKNLKEESPYKPDPVLRSREWGTIHLVAGLLARSSDLPDDSGEQPSMPSFWSCSKWGLPKPLMSPSMRWSLTPPFHPYRVYARRFFSVALSRGLPRVGVTHHFALRSPDFPRHHSILCCRNAVSPDDSSRSRIREKVDAR